MKEKISGQGFFKKKKVTSAFSVFAAIAGFAFLRKTITGNTVSSQGYTINVISVIGLLLLFCSGLLVYYTLKKV